MNDIKISGKSYMNEVNLSIHILASLPEEYKITVNFLEDCVIETTAHVPLGICMLV